MRWSLTKYNKIGIYVIQERTTRCKLRVHGIKLEIKNSVALISAKSNDTLSDWWRWEFPLKKTLHDVIKCVCLYTCGASKCYGWLIQSTVHSPLNSGQLLHVIYKNKFQLHSSSQQTRVAHTSWPCTKHFNYESLTLRSKHKTNIRKPLDKPTQDTDT